MILICISIWWSNIYNGKSDLACYNYLIADYHIFESNPGIPFMEYFLCWWQIYKIPSYGAEYRQKCISMALTIPIANYTALQLHLNITKSTDPCQRNSGHVTTNKQYWYVVQVTDFMSTINNVQRPPVLESWANPLPKYFMKNLAPTQSSVLAISFCLYGP